jgi:Ca2+/Na+ antiporter
LSIFFFLQAVPLEWWPLTRDCAIYGSIVIGLAVVVSDNRVFWWEAMIFVLCYGVYLAGIKFFFFFIPHRNMNRGGGSCFFYNLNNTANLLLSLSSHVFEPNFGTVGQRGGCAIQKMLRQDK